MTCVGGVRGHTCDTTCDGMRASRGNCEMMAETCVSLVVTVLQGEYRTNLPNKMGLNGSLTFWVL